MAGEGFGGEGSGAPAPSSSAPVGADPSSGRFAATFSRKGRREGRPATVDDCGYSRNDVRIEVLAGSAQTEPAGGETIENTPEVMPVRSFRCKADGSPLTLAMIPSNLTVDRESAHWIEGADCRIVLPRRSNVALGNCAARGSLGDRAATIACRDHRPLSSISFGQQKAQQRRLKTPVFGRADGAGAPSRTRARTNLDSQLRGRAHARVRSRALRASGRAQATP